MLVIAAPSFDAPSETFIRSQVRNICPGETALICFSDKLGELSGLPAIADVQPRWQSATSWPARLRRIAERELAAQVRPEIYGRRRDAVVEFLRAHRPSAVLAEYGPTGCLLAGVCAEAAVPLYVHFHGYDASMLLRKARWRRHYRKLFRHAAGIVVPSRLLADNLLRTGCPADKLHVGAYGVDAEVFSETVRRPQRLVAVGRLVEKKAPLLTISAFAQIADRFPEARLDIVGDGELAASCRKLVEDLGLAGRVNLLGKRDSGTVADLMANASIFVQHSVTAANGDCEGTPVAVLEAMSSALPVVSTRHSGIADAVQHGVTGLLVEERDVEGMAAGIAGLLADPDRAAEMGRAGRRRVLDHYTVQSSSDRLRAVMGLPPLAGGSGEAAAGREGAAAPPGVNP